jgi:integrase
MVREDRRGDLAFLTADAVDRLLAAADSLGTTDALALRLVLLTGSRRGEVTKMEWSWVDLDNGFIHRPASAMKNGKASSIPLSGDALAILKRLHTPPSATGLVFGRINLRHFFDKVRERAGLPNVRLHDLRHTFASRLLNAGVDIFTVPKLLAHSDVSITSKTYGHLASTAGRTAADLFAASIKPTAPDMSLMVC